MFLKSISIQGFKSFPDKTKLNFEKGITVVVGPNGSGKSNIADAVSWVLGEQSAKNLRGGKMEDVIFNGTQSRKAMGFSQVIITIDNFSKNLPMDADEVSISRKYYRSGVSEYSINGNNVRLRDVQELLMDTGLGRDGYAVISQGKIAEIISAKGYERRQIFEEAAGISKYKYRKIRSERQLESTEENLLRLKDIILEIESRIEPLRNQSEKAERFVLLSNEGRNLEISLYINKLENFKTEIKKYEDELFLSGNDFNNVEKNINDLEEEVKAVYDKLNMSSIFIESKRQEKTEIEKKLFDSNSEIAVLKNDINHKNENVEKLNNKKEFSQKDIADISLLILEKEKKSLKLLENIKEISKNREKTQNELSEILNNSLTKTKQKEKILKEINITISKISGFKIKEMTTKNNIDNLLYREKDIGNSILNLQKQKEHLYKDENESNEYYVILAKKIADKKKNISAIKENYEFQKGIYKKNEVELIEFKNSILNNANKIKLLKDLEESMEDFTFSVKSIMNAKKQGMILGIHGPVSNLISVAKQYTLAIETALSYSLQNIVVDNESVAKKAIYYLQEKKTGRCTFLPMTSIKGSKLSGVSGKGFLGIASDVVDFDDKYLGIINQLLGRVVVCDNIDNAINIAKKNGYKFRIVTLDGQIVNAGGSLTGGSKVRTSGILSRKNEIQELQQKTKEMRELLNTKEKNISDISSSVDNVFNEFSTLEQELQIIIDDEKEIKHHLISLRNSLIEKKLQEKELLIEENEISEKKEKLLEENLYFEKEKVDSIKHLDKIEQELEKNDDGVDALFEKKEYLTQKSSDFQIDILHLEKEVALINQSIDEHRMRSVGEEKEYQNMDEEIRHLNLDIEKISVNIDLLKENINISDKKIIEIDDEIIENINSRTKLEMSTSSIRSEEKELTKNREEIAKEKIRLEERKINKQLEHDKIVADLWEEYELTVSGARENAKTLYNIKESEIKLRQIKNQIKSLGVVNVSAIEEYKEISERYIFLTKQIYDVEKSKEELKNLISELTSTMQTMFLESFDAIDKEFSKAFINLFDGGEASLALTERDNVLESGIEINVQPPGKLIKNIESLSGGEKAFVAIAIYFAILKVKPAPFCLLDEIEAALDDVNVVKFALYLKNLASNTQFIVISHRRGTMEESDALYGVTMQEEGVSKLLQIKLNESEKELDKLGIKTE